MAEEEKSLVDKARDLTAGLYDTAADVVAPEGGDTGAVATARRATASGAETVAEVARPGRTSAARKSSGRRKSTASRGRKKTTGRKKSTARKKTTGRKKSTARRKPAARKKTTRRRKR
ncbi:MAG TPA: hypothetical protein VNP73_01250 [Actinomycetota bacterium]|nr:hypothetical protein [Actinomycetota bacterium]